MTETIEFPLNESQESAYIIFSDVQGNYSSLERFFNATKNMRKKGYICLGDIVNRLEDFNDNRSIEAVRTNVDFCVKGNHDIRISSKSKEKIYPKNLNYLRNLPVNLSVENMLLFHSSIFEKNKRLRSQKQIYEEAVNIQKTRPNTRYVLFGHTHQKGAYTLDGGLYNHKTNKINLDPSKLNLINPGGIGLWDNMENTFARLNPKTGELRFFTLEEAEDLNYKANLTKTFDNRWMSELNINSYPWFVNYLKRDIPLLKEKSKRYGFLEPFVKRLEGFELPPAKGTSSLKLREYLRDYSEVLAKELVKISIEAKGLYGIKDPLETRNEYLSLDRKKY